MTNFKTHGLFYITKVYIQSNNLMDKSTYQRDISDGWPKLIRDINLFWVLAKEDLAKLVGSHG